MVCCHYMRKAVVWHMCEAAWLAAVMHMNTFTEVRIHPMCTTVGAQLFPEVSCSAARLSINSRI